MSASAPTVLIYLGASYGLAVLILLGAAFVARGAGEGAVRLSKTEVCLGALLLYLLIGLYLGVLMILAPTLQGDQVWMPRPIQELVFSLVYLPVIWPMYMASFGTQYQAVVFTGVAILLGNATLLYLAIRRLRPR